MAPGNNIISFTLAAVQMKDDRARERRPVSLKYLASKGT
jgi:hypothetical protein